MHGINGLVYGNNTGYIMNRGVRVRRHILGMGTEVDLHSPHWHGATLLHSGHRLDVTEILPPPRSWTWRRTTQARGCSTAMSTTTSWRG